MKKVLSRFSLKAILISLGVAVVVIGGIVAAVTLGSSAGSDNIERLPVSWPASFLEAAYEEPAFIDDPNRDNNAFNIADFGEQGNNGWFYRYASSSRLLKSKRIEGFNGSRYFQSGADGLEIKKDFIHTGNGVAPVLEWRVARDGAVDVLLTYVKDVNGDSNPNYPDGVCIYVYKEDELLASHRVPVQVDAQTLLETKIEDLDVVEDESLYFIVDPQNNNAYDGGQLYVAIVDAGAEPVKAQTVSQRKDNNANNIEDFGYQGKNGWCYMYGKSVEKSALVSTNTADGYINYTSPALTISKSFIHPAINDNAILSWTPAVSGPIEVRGKYTKFAQQDGNPDWPDGVVISMYLNDKKLFEKEVEVLRDGEVTVKFRQSWLSVTPEDRLYFVVNANGNSSYDGGCFDISILDRSGRITEKSITVPESDTRQNFASVQHDFGAQGNNGWFFQEGYEDDPFGAYNISRYVKDDKYYDNYYLEIKRDYVNTGERGESAVIKWRVAQDGVIRINASYTKTINQDANPSWPDGTRVTLWHNNTLLASQEFAPLSYEVTKSLNVDSLTVKRGDYITMVINGKENNAYDGGKFTFNICGVSDLVGATEKNVKVPNDDKRTNNANVLTDFGAQGNNGWFFQYGYYTDPFYAINIEKYESGEKYYTVDGVEIKRDYIMPSTKDKSANVKWKVAQDGLINIYADYTKLLNEDANPSWPDGVTVTLLHNSKVLKSEYFAPDTKNEIKKDLSVMGLQVKKGDFITLIVNGGANTAYDGGLYSFVIEDAAVVAIDRVNNSGENRADLASDFNGQQGSNGWYYMEGRNPATASALTKKTGDGSGYQSEADSDLQVKSDFVQPGANKAAMYQWVAAVDGTVDVQGSYTKFGHQDGNPSWPDGTRVKVYLNDTLLFEQDAKVLQGDGNNTVVPIELKGKAVKKGDIFTFAIESKDNVAWDGGRLSIQIAPTGEGPRYTNGTGSNNANLKNDFVENSQGAKGWYYGYGNTGGDGFNLGTGAGFKYTGGVDYPDIALQPDYVAPVANMGAIYRWVAANDGSIDLNGKYTKYDNTGSVNVKVYLNGALVEGLSFAGVTGEQVIEKSELSVNKDDIIDFVITAVAGSANNSGKLEMAISEHGNTAEPDPEYKNDATANTANLATDFGAQGNNGWYYGYCKWNGADFTPLSYNPGDRVYKGDNGLELKADFVHPGPTGDYSAAYMWVAAKDGQINIAVNYAKESSGENDGVSFRLIIDNAAHKEDNYKKVNSGETHNFDKTYTVTKGDKIIFAINPEGNNSNDGGKLEVTISEVGGSDTPAEPEYKNDAARNTANLANDFGAQGNNGWYYGYCDWNGTGFTPVAYIESDGAYKGDNGLELKKDFVHPGKDGGHSAAYMWVAAQDGKINITGSYVKESSVETDGVSFRLIIHNDDNYTQVKSGVTHNFDKTYTVAKGDKIIFAINPEGNNSYDAGKLEVTITDVSSAANALGAASEDNAIIKVDDVRDASASEKSEVTVNKETPKYEQQPLTPAPSESKADAENADDEPEMDSEKPNDMEDEAENAKNDAIAKTPDSEPAPEVSKDEEKSTEGDGI